MVHTLPDYTTKYKMATIFGQIDTGELAARLGGINIFDRRGDTVFQDNFETVLLKWILDTGGGDGTGVLSSEYARNGDQSVKLTSSTGAENFAVIYKYLPVCVGTKIGFEISFTSHVDVDRILTDVGIYDGTTYHHATAGVSITDDRVYLINSAGAPVILSPALKLYNYVYSFHTLKLVFDYSTGYYTRVIFDDQTFDASSYAIETSGSNIARRMWFGLWCINSKAGNPSIYVDDAIITQNEP